MLSMRGLYSIKAIGVLTKITCVFHDLEQHQGTDEKTSFFPRQKNFRMQFMTVQKNYA